MLTCNKLSICNTSIIYGLIIDPDNEQLPIDLIAQLAEHCTDTAEVMGSNQIQSFLTAIQLVLKTVRITH